MQIDLTDEQRELLIETLDRSLSDLSVEIADTDKMDYREMLKRRRDNLKAVLEQLRAAPGA